MSVAILIMAAGASSRMGSADKLLLAVDGEPLLRRIAGQAVGTGATVGVTLPPGDTERRAVLEGLPVSLIEVADAARGMSASIVAGVEYFRDTQAIILQPADMPDITTADFQAIIDAFGVANSFNIVCATSAAGQPGHPVLFPAPLFEELSGLTGDRGAKAVIAAHRSQVIHIARPGTRALTDLDNPEDWDNWRRKSP